MLEHQQSASSTGYLVSESSIYPSAVTAAVSSASKTSPSRYQCNDISSQYDQNALNATQRRHAFSAFRNLRGGMNSGVSLTGGSTSLESFADSPGPAGSSSALNDTYNRRTEIIDYSQSYHDPNRLTVPLSSDFIPVGSKLHFRHHSYDVPPPPPAPDDDGVRRRTLSTVFRGHHSFDSAPNNAYSRRQNDYVDQQIPPNWQNRQNMADIFYDGVGVDTPRRNVDSENYFEPSRGSEQRYRSSSYVDAMTSSYDTTGRGQYNHQQQQQFRQSEPINPDRQQQQPHFSRRNTDEGYNSYSQQQQQQQQQQKMYNNPSTAPYDQYYSSSSTRLIPNSDDCRQESFQDYPQREVFYNGQAETRLMDNLPIKSNDNHLEANGYYPFNNHIVTNFSNLPPVTSSSTALAQSQASQIYPAESINITTNKSHWEWNNNGVSYSSAATNYNGGIRNYDYPNGTKQQFNGYNVGYPDVLQKDSHGGFNVVHSDQHNGSGGVNLDICRGGKEDPTTFFRDGVRKIDFVMVYEETHKEAANNFETLQPKTNLNQNPLEDQETKGLKKRQKFNLWRQKFMACLAAIGVQIEEDVLEQSKNTIHFIRLHAPWPLLCRYAEELNLRAPIQINTSLADKQSLGMKIARNFRRAFSITTAHPNPSGNWSEWILSKLRLPNLMYEDVPNKPLDYYTCPFKTSKLDKFLGSEDLDSFFTRAQRSRMVYEILATTPFGKEKKGEVGIERLVDEGAYTAAFPLHDGPFEHPGVGTPPSQLNVRQILFQYWARWGKWYKYQPLDHIREYFGEKIAIYFAWLGFYTGWLLPAAVVGMVVFLYGVATMDMNQIALEVCNEGSKYEMCPLCESCSLWKLSDICLYKRVAYLFDHPGTVFYAIFMSFWAVTFLEYWKRKSASLAHHWDCMGFQEEEERPRPDFAAKAPYLEKNPITGVKEPSFPQSIRYKRIAAGTGLILLMISLVLIFIVAVIIYRTLVAIPLFQDETLRPVAQMIASMSGAMLNLILIMALGRVYEKLAFGLTTWEMHRTQSEFDDNLTFKVFLFQFINFYSSIFYIAFFKGRFVGYPGHYKHIFGNLRNEDCSNGGCLIELAQQLGVIMVGKQMINNAQEIILPKLKAWWHSKKSKLSTIGESRMEMDYRLVENEGLFQEYLEMVLQFGFITIFVAAFPLAPFFALLNNWVEIRLDAQKFVCETRRAVAERAENIGIWFKILDMIAHFAVISNAFLIAFTSEFIAKLVYKYEHDWDMRGYVNFTLAVSPHEGWLDQNRSECRYRAFRDESGQFSPTHWKILALKLSFVIIFEHVVFGVCRLIDLVVPDIPESLDVKIKRERYLAKEALQDADHVLQKVLIDPESDRGVDSDQDISTGSPMMRKRTLL